MKIGIITFHASFNYGSMLQAWALQTYLESLGHEVHIVNYRSRIQRLTYHKPIDFHNVENSLSSCKRLLLYPSSIKPLNKKWHLFDDFLHHELHLTKEYHTVRELEQAHFDFDLLICGSDQIWNTNAPDSGEAYYGNWFKGRKISYAASFGQFPENIDMDFVKAQMKNFSALSVREEKTKNVLFEAYLTKDIAVVCDPTLLLPAETYHALARGESLVKERYIFFYTPVGMPYEYFTIANNLAERTGIEVVTEKAYYPKDLKKYPHIHEYLPTGPREFLNLVKNATIVCGGSFHLQVFSILFHKNFYCINGDKDARTNNLLSKCGLENRIISLDKPNEITNSTISEWEAVDYRLHDEAKASENWLRETAKGIVTARRNNEFGNGGCAKTLI